MYLGRMYFRGYFHQKGAFGAGQTQHTRVFKKGAFDVSAPSSLSRKMWKIIRSHLHRIAINIFQTDVKIARIPFISVVAII